jgi:hypothetical protein
MYLMIDSDALGVPDGQRSLLPLDLHSRVARSANRPDFSRF